MRSQLGAALLLLCLAVAACSAQSEPEPDIEVLGHIDVKYSEYTYRGEVLNVTSYNNGPYKVIHRFRRVPYARPPTGDRRFARPEPLNFTETMTVDATKQAPLCPQDNTTKGRPYEEDCLYFNVWSPSANGSQNYSVLVYIHGGRFETGGIADPEIQGETFLRNQDVVLITINFRLGATGFLFLDDEKLPGNFGLLDQRLALKTIATLAETFGGDPTKITLAGHGTGAASVGFHITSNSLPLSRAVMMGGSPLMPLVWSNDRDRVKGLSESFVNIQLNCARGEGRLAEVIDCLRKNVSIETIIENQKVYERLFTSLEFMPVLDREFFNLHDPLVEWGNRRKNVTILMGIAADSGSDFVDNSLRSRNLTIDILNRTVYYEILRRQFDFYPRFPTRLDDTGLKFLQLSHTEWNDFLESSGELLRNMWSRALGDFNYLCPTLYALFDDFRPKPGNDMNTFLYYFNAPDHIKENADPGHENDLRYFFGIPDGPGIAYPEQHNNLSKRMMEDLASFVKGQKPNPSWDSVVAGEWNYNSYILNEDPGLYNLTGGFAIRRCRWWNEALSFVNRLVPGTSAAAAKPGHLRRDPFELDQRPAAEESQAVEPEAAINLPVTTAVEGNITVELPGTGGAKITGQELKTADDKVLHRFLGIPYAQPPTGDLRFTKPVKHAISGALIDATKMPKACPQAYGTLEESEDCLYLNIWAPKLATDAKVPVLVYIHGGFFEVGGINDPARSGEKLIELQDVIVVTIGYRLGALGFLSFLQSGSYGNFGLHDQELALNWVDEHIEAFGGNSSLITLVGDDAGAVAIGYHMIRNTTGFSRAILQTGSPSLAYPLSDDQAGVRQRVRQFLGLMGCNLTTAALQLSCMRGKSVKEIQDVYTNQFVNQFGPEALVSIDTDFLKEDPWLSVQKGNLKQVPLIVGFVDRPGNEIIRRRMRYGAINLANVTSDIAIENFVAASYYNPRKPNVLKDAGATLIGMQYRSPLSRRQVVIDSLSEAYSDRFYTCGNNEFLYQVTSKRNQLDAFIYHYVFTEKSNIEGITTEGAGLSEDTYYLFGNPLLGNQWSNEQKNLSIHLMKLVVNFAKTGNPNPPEQLDLWYEYTTNRKPYLILDADVYNVSLNWGFRINDCGFWQEVLPYVNTLTEAIPTPEPPTTRPPIGPEGIIIDEIIIEIDLSTKRSTIKGDVVQLPNGKNITRFLGVPYAKFPLLRFANAEMPTQIDVDARQMPPACPQLIRPAGANLSEDCLYINIWAPVRSAQNHPVAVFLHGGNYTSGANSLSEYRGEQLLESQDVILVSVNYRLGALGFLYLDDEKLPGNFGLMDQRLALSFIQRLIPAFGGDKDRVTLIGHGTDAASAAFHAVTESNNTFARMILMGGSPSMPLAWSSSIDEVRKVNEDFVNIQLDCARGPLDGVLACLRNLSLQRIMSEQLNMYNSLDHLVFVPVFAKAFFQNLHPYTQWTEGKVEKPIMTGVGSDSGRYYTEQSLARRNISWESLNRTIFETIIDRQFRYSPRFPIRNQATGLQFLKLALTEWNYFDYNKRIKAIWSQAMGDFNFLCPIWEAVSDLLRAKSHPIHMYYIDVEDPFRGVEGLNGADHWGDIRYLFGDPFRRDGYPEAHKKISRQIMDDFVQYMKGAAMRWNATSYQSADFMFYDVLLADAGGPGTEVAVVVEDGFGLNSGRCPLWKNELPYVNNFTTTTAEDVDIKKLNDVVGQQSISRKAPESSPFNLASVISNYSIPVGDFGTIWGQTVKTHSNVTMSQFLGIPFAKPPTGNLRFAKPVKPETTSATVHHALSMPPMCIQKSYYSLPMAEDCLYLNVWTPKRQDRDVSNLPVLVFLPGGFFEVGGTNEDRWHGSMILDHHDVVVVTINYRLGVFGFLTLDDKELKGNYGLYDQELALQWVKDYIDQFGGNKNRITLMGVEAGAVSIGYHMARKSQTRFHQVILMTGSPLMSYPLTNDLGEVHRLHGNFVRNLMRCEGGPDRLQCLRDFDATRLNELQTLFQKLFTGLEFSPVLDGEFIAKDPWETAPNELMHVPMIFGGVDRPGNFFIERLAGNELVTPENFTHSVYLNALQFMNDFFPRFPTQMTISGVNGLRNHFMQYNQQGKFQRDLRDLGLALSDRYFTCANNKFLDAYSKASSLPVYNYLFTESKMYDEDAKLPLDQASLFEDAYYAFGNPSSPGPPRPNEQTRLSQAFMESIVTFATTGVPSNLLKWDRYDSTNKSHLLLDADVLPPVMFQDGYRRQECGFWDHTLPYVNSLSQTSTAAPRTTPRPTRPPIGPDGLVLGNVSVIFNGVAIIGQRVLVQNEDAVKNISRFLGVPYAQPPVNELRFAEPKRHPLGDTVIAHTLPPACPQDNSSLGIPYSEDCLYLNIWTPNAETGRNYPTIVYIHGGNFETGSISERELYGETLLSHQDVVLFTMAYRLGSLGFLYLDDGALPGNAGLLDQRLALFTITQLVESFGGNRQSITLAGHGTGAAAVGFHSVTSSNGGFKRAVLMGGSPTMPVAWYDAADGKERTRLLNKAFVDLQLNCARPSINDSIACIRSLNVKTIIDAQTPFLKLLHSLEFRPVLDRTFFENKDPLVAWRNQESAHVEMLVGFTTETGGGYVDQALRNANRTIANIDAATYRRILNETFRYYPRFPRQLSETGREFIYRYLDDYVGRPDKYSLRDTWSQATGDRYFLCPVWESVVQKGRNRPSTDTYLYVFTARDPFDEEKIRFGSDHHADLQYFFGLPAGTGAVYPQAHTRLSKRMMRDLVLFAKDGRPNPSWQKTKLGVWDYSDYNDNYEYYNATEGHKTIQRCGVWYYDLPFVDGLVTSNTMVSTEMKKLPSRSIEKLPDLFAAKEPRPKVSPTTDTVLRNFTIDVSGFGQVAGHTVRTLDNNIISKFLGVRYAEPPLGSLRFRKPTALRNAGDGVVHDARAVGASCYQRRYYSLTMSEDCLFLNIWTPRHSENNVTGLPVIVFIHGGFFEVGSSAEPRWEGRNILDHEQAVIVTINYRLGAFGFLAVDSSVTSNITGNMGLFDQEAAISWVARNIEAFGGDKNKITLAGVEAGSISIGYHLIRQPIASKPFSKVIMMTGSPMQSYPLSDKPDIVRQFHAEFVRDVTRLNCSINTAACLQALSAEFINEKQAEFNSIFRGVEFQPIIDKEFFQDDPWALVSSGNFSKMPMIIGQTSSPGNFLLERIVGNTIINKENFTLDTYRQALVESNRFFPRFPGMMTTSGQELLKLFKTPWSNLESFDLKIQEWAEALSDRYFTCDITEFTDRYAAQNANSTFYFVFAEKGLFQSEHLPLIGSTLFEDAYYFFGNPTSPGPPASMNQAKLSEAIMKRFVKFARDGNPNSNSGAPSWLPYDNGQKNLKLFLALGTERFPEVKHGFRRQDCGWWESVLPYVDDLVFPITTTSATAPTSTRTNPPSSTTTQPPQSTATTTSRPPETTTPRASTSAWPQTTTGVSTTSTRPPIGPPQDYYAVVSVIPILGIAFVAGAVFILVKVVMGAAVAVAPAAGAATAAGGTAFAASAAAAETGASAGAAAASSSATDPSAAQHAEVVNEAYDADAGNADNADADAGNGNAGGSTTNL